MTEPVSLHDAEETLEATQAKRYEAYPAYRPSGIDWLGDLPEHWDVRRLKFIAKTIMGQSPSSDDYTVDEDALPFLQGNAEFGPVNPSARYYCDAATKQAPVGSLLISVRAPVGAVNIADQPYGIGRGLCAVVPDSLLLLPSFTWYALPVTRNELWSIATGSTYEAVSANEVAAMSMPLPPLDEQQNIARFLDEQTKKIDDLIEAKRDLLALLKEKRKSVITHAVKRGLNSDVTLKPSGVEWLGDVPEHWRIVLLRRLISEMRNGTSTNQDVESEHSVPVTRIETISNGFINFAKVGYVEYDKALEPYRLQRGDILMSHINSLQMIGNCAFYDSDKVLFNGMNVLRIQPQSNVHSEWLWQTLASNLYRQAIRSIAKPAINQASVTTTQIKQLQIPLPPHDEQRAIAQFLREHTTKIDVVINEASAAITQLTDYRTALISAAVTGKIDLRGGAA